jgi:hypothetical protein
MTSSPDVPEQKMVPSHDKSIIGMYSRQLDKLIESEIKTK